jgi:hypothetical protein
MVQFWLNNPTELINTDNFKGGTIEFLNLFAVFSVIIGTSLTLKTKNSKFTIITLVILLVTVLIYLTKKAKFKSNFTKTDELNTNLSNTYDTGIYLTKAVKYTQDGLNNLIYVNQALNFNKGDIIALSSNGKILESNIITDVQYTTADNTPVVVLLNPLKKDYSKYTTKILKVSDSSPNIITPPDANVSIENANKSYISDPMQMAVENYPKFNLPNADRNDWNLELSTDVPGLPNSYQYQGQPYGNLKCRQSDINNPMGVIQVPEYDAAPTMYGTCNVQEDNNNNKMTTNQEATVSQRVGDLLFHKGNAQAQFSPVAVDTMPNDQEAFAHWCYRSPTNLVNPKYASIFMNDPEKFKLVSKLARATGTENGGG